MNAKQIVSVALCTCNGERFIEKQLNSVLSQTVPVDEIVICDDLSTDKTIELAKKALIQTELKCKIVINTKRLGVTKNFEKCIGLCSGTIIFTSDQDDEWETDKVESMLPLFEDKRVILALSDAVAVDDRANVVYSSLLEHVHFISDAISIPDILIRRQQSLYGCLMAFRRELYDISMPFPETVFYHDGWLGIMALLVGEISFTERKLVNYTISEFSITQSNKGQTIWREEFEKGDNYEKRFVLNSFRRERIELFKCGLSRTESNYINRKARKMMLKSISMYESLYKIKDYSFFRQACVLIISFLKGDYYYRNMNRDNRNNLEIRLKMLISDLIFLWKY